MRSVIPGRLYFLISLVAFSLVVGAVPASAAIDPGDYTIRQLDIPIAGDDPGIGGGSIGCGKGKRVVTGGAFWHREVEGPDVGLDAYLASSAPTPNGRRWFAAGVSWVNDDLLLRIVAYCLPASAVGDYFVRRAVRTFQDDVKAKDLRCGTGRRIVTGGAFWHHAGPGSGPCPAAPSGTSRVRAVIAPTGRGSRRAFPKLGVSAGTQMAGTRRRRANCGSWLSAARPDPASTGEPAGALGGVSAESQPQARGITVRTRTM